jgi:hypothetical protein
MSRKNVYKLNSKHLISDESELSEDNQEVDWSLNTENEKNDTEKEKNKKNSSDDEDDELEENIFQLQEMLSQQKHTVADPEINIEVVEDENKEKAVKVSINLELENESNDIINIDFTINKKTFLKIAKQLK